MSMKVSTYKIANEFSKNKFIRESWIALAKEDVPLEVFNENFEDVSVVKHQVVVDSISAAVSYQASVGYDRQEPYLATESYYDNSTKTRKERQVTKYKTVTDWKPISNSCSEYSTAIVENASEVKLDSVLFRESLSKSVKKEVAENELEITDFAQKKIYREHYDNLCYYVARKLPGDHYKDIDVKIDSIEGKTSNIYLASEYMASISYGGKKYTKYAFPFGYTMNIGGDKIENTESAEQFEKRQLRMLSNNEKERNNSKNKRLWKANKKIVFITVALMLVAFSSGFLYFLPRILTTLISLLFPVSLIYTIVKWVKSNEKVADSIKKENEEEKTRVYKEIEEYAQKRKEAIRDALNKKLISLEMEKVSDVEFS